MRLQTQPRVLFALRPNAKPVFDGAQVEKYKRDATLGSAALRDAQLRLLAKMARNDRA